MLRWSCGVERAGVQLPMAPCFAEVCRALWPGVVEMPPRVAEAFSRKRFFVGGTAGFSGALVGAYTVAGAVLFGQEPSMYGDFVLCWE